MAMHFGESLEMHIPLSIFKRAIEFLHKEEKNMHLALIMDGKNPQSKAIGRILACLENEAKTFVEICCEVFTILPDRSQIDEVLSFLNDTGQITMDIKTIREKEVVYWSLRK